MMLQELLDKKIELLNFVAEMNDLIDKGILRHPSDFQLWLEDVEDECQYCFKEISEIVNMHIRNVLSSHPT